MDQEMAPEQEQEQQQQQQLNLPGFRFHPTEEELLDFYLKNMVFGKKLRCDIIGYLNIYQYDPRELPGLSKIGEREWYFFVPRDRKHGPGGRPNRTTANGFWKATGSDRKIFNLSEPKRVLGLRKTLVFYNGRAPRGTKTDWVMNEYRLPDTWTLPKVQDIVLCKIYRKATSLKVLEQRAAMEEEMKICQHQSPSSSPLSPADTISFCGQQEDTLVVTPIIPPLHLNYVVLKKEVTEDMVPEMPHNNIKEIKKWSSPQLPMGKVELPELQVPNKSNTDWNTQDSFWLSSPWLSTSNTPSYANMLNFYA